MADVKIKKPNLTDPLEAAKMAKPPAPTSMAVADEPAPAPVEIKPDPPAAPIVRYRVAASTNISLNGQIIRLNKDDIISAESYGPENMAKILAGNAVLVTI